MPVDILTVNDKKYSINYRIPVRDMSEEECDIIKARTFSSVVLVGKGQVLFGNEIEDVEFEDVVDEIVPETPVSEASPKEENEDPPKKEVQKVQPKVTPKKRKKKKKKK